MCIVRRVFVLVDARVGIKPVDWNMIESLTKHKLTTQVVLTKIDLVSELQLHQTLDTLFQLLMGERSLEGKKRLKSASVLPIVHATHCSKASKALGIPNGLKSLKEAIAELQVQEWKRPAVAFGDSV